MAESDSKIYINRFENKIYENSNGQLHRLDGPSIEWIDGSKYWCILDKYLEEKEFNSWTIRIQKCI